MKGSAKIGRAQVALALGATVLVVVVTAAVVVVSLGHYHRTLAAQEGTTSQFSGSASDNRAVVVPKVVHASLPATPSAYLGVYEGSDLTAAQYAQVEQFGTAVGRQPDIDLYYSSWGEPFSVSFANLALKHGTSLLVDLDPTNVSLASIAAGRDDGFLDSYADSLKVFGHSVLISFGHEMNGNWYPWGWTQSSPADFIAAWRHIVDVFRADGADNVTWVWTVNAIATGEGPIADYWPGSAYVDWVAFDAYYYQPGSDFSSVFGPTITAIRQFTDKPILIGETAIGQVVGQAAQIPGLFAGVASDGLLGFVWFDQAQDDGIYHQDWRLEGHPVALAAFKAAAATYLSQPAAPSSSSSPSAARKQPGATASPAG